MARGASRCVRYKLVCLSDRLHTAQLRAALSTGRASSRSLSDPLALMASMVGRRKGADMERLVVLLGEYAFVHHHDTEKAVPPLCRGLPYVPSGHPHSMSAAQWMWGGSAAFCSAELLHSGLLLRTGAGTTAQMDRERPRPVLPRSIRHLSREAKDDRLSAPLTGRRHWTLLSWAPRLSTRGGELRTA